MEFGADDRTNLEPASLISVLDELEEWSSVLKAEPEVIHKLQEFEVAALRRDEKASLSETRTPSRRKPTRGPSL